MAVSGHHFAALTESFCNKCENWESLNASALAHLRSLYDILELRNCCSSDEQDVQVPVLRKARGPRVMWADEQQPIDPPALNLTSRLFAQDCCLQAAVLRKSAAPLATCCTLGSDDPSCEATSGEVRFVPFPPSCSHPVRVKALSATNPRAMPWTPVVPSGSPPRNARSSAMRTPPSPSARTHLGEGFSVANGFHCRGVPSVL